MSSASRAIKRKNELKKRKALKKGLNQVLRATSGIPSNCTLCSKDFDDNANPDEWYMRIQENNIILTCPECFSN